MNKFKIGIFGDAMIDEYFFVSIKDISPEFPIPIMLSEQDTPKVYPGGAANVFSQYRYFNNVDPYLISFLDEDFISHFEEINKDFSLKIDGKIPRKKRFYSKDVPTYRWDVEQSLYGLKEKIKESCEKLYSFYNNIHNFDALIISDYDKGVFFLKDKNFIPKDIISIVDSKSLSPEKWFGCTVFKSNLSEAQKISGKEDIQDAASWIKSFLRCENVVITNAENGFFVLSNNFSKRMIPESTIEANSVVGAGDCFTAVLTLSLLEGLDIFSASYRAWKAGSIYVTKKYNSPICPLDLIDGKNVSDLSLFEKRNFKLVFTNGCFDLIHSGHIESLKYAKSKGDKLVVALNSDVSVASIKKGRPIQNLQDRINIISSIEFVDYIVVFDELDPLNILKKIKPDVIVKGSEYQFDQIVGSDIINEVHTCPMISDLSTSILIDRTKKLLREEIEND